MDLIFAYVDPGSGSLIIQAVIAGLVAAPFVFRNKLRQWSQSVRHAIGRDREEATEPAPGSEPPLTR